MATDRERVVAQARAERRRYLRVRVDLPGRLFVPAEEREAQCQITDLSPGGAQATCAFVPAAEAQIVLYIDGFGRFEGVVARPGEGKFGVKFICSALKRERVAEQLTLYMNGGIVDEAALRRHEREPTKGLARFTRANGDIVACEVLDLSLSGVSLKTEARPPMGETVLIGQMAGRIVRHHENGVAIEFVGGNGAAAEREKAKLSVVR
ncbi:MAG TPA: PilZ domain-containing protein [Rhizomicrobium sp.]|nr:PilZ domain-containing protein [Rhizomicrobium sp.]